MNQKSREKLLDGHPVGEQDLQGAPRWLQPDAVSHRRGQPRPSNFFFYISDDGEILGIRMGDWKMVLTEQRANQLCAGSSHS